MKNNGKTGNAKLTNMCKTAIRGSFLEGGGRVKIIPMSATRYYRNEKNNQNCFILTADHHVKYNNLYAFSSSCFVFNFNPDLV